MRRGEAAVWGIALTFAIGVVIAVVLGFDVVGVAFLILAGVAVLLISQMMSNELDRTWLPTFVIVGFMAKMIGAAFRYGVFDVIYLRQGDAAQYHFVGVQLARVWRNFQVPSMGVAGSQGTRLVEMITGFLYAPYTPDIFTGFLIFATLAFGGQLLFYAAFRRAVPRARLKLYAFVILFTPSLVFWPSSIGKEALMLLFIGFASYAVVKLFEGFEVKWLALFAGGALAAGAIRPHVGALLVASFSLAALLTKSRRAWRVRLRKIVMLSAGGIAVLFAFTVFAERFGLTAEEFRLDFLLDEVTRRTGSGGSAVSGRAVQSIGDMPQALLRVVFRPLINEVFGPVGLASSLEGTLLLILTLWKTPSILKNTLMLRRHPYLMFCFLYFMGFVVVFSPILNLGILARQRTQMVPLLLVILVAMGWKWQQKEKKPEETEPLSPAVAT